MIISAFIRRNLFWLNDLLKGSPVRSQYQDIRSILENYEYGNEMRKNHLSNLLNHITSYSSFYQKYKNKPFKEFPISNKTFLLNNYDSMKVELAFIPMQTKPLYIQRTSGSTGTPFAVPQDTRKRNRRLAELKYFGKIAGFNSHEKLIHLRAWNRWQSKTKNQSFKENIIPFDISNLSNENIKELCDIVNKNNALALRGYASSIDMFVQYAIKNNIKFPRLKIIIAGSEALLDTTRDFVKRHIGCNIISQYANEENGILAQESVFAQGKEIHFYLNHASYFFEILRMDSDEPAEYGELGRIIITDYFNYAFPIIRYDTGDTGIMQEKDEYSRGYPILSKLFGRKMDIVYDVINNPVHPMAIGRVLKNYPDISQWQFIQKSQKKYLLKINSNTMQHDAVPIVAALLNLLGDTADIAVEYVETIPILASGKRKPVVNEWKLL